MEASREELRALHDRRRQLVELRTKESKRLETVETAHGRNILYMSAVVSTRRWNPILRDFYQRLIAKGKPAKLALTAVMRKLIVLLNRLVANPDFVLHERHCC